MGLFNRKKEIGRFTIHHYPNNELVFENTLAEDKIVFGFALYLDKQIYNCGEEYGTKLWGKIFCLAGVMYGAATVEDNDKPLEERKMEYTGGYRVVSSSKDSNPLTVVAKLMEHNNLYYCDCEVTPITSDPEEAIMAGCETVFTHLFDT